MRIHPTATVDPKAELAPDVQIGPYAVIEGPCVLGTGVEIGPHAVVLPYVRLGAGVKVGPHCVLGGEPQDLSFKPVETWLEVGANTVLRDYVMLHRSSKPEQPTTIGQNCYFMGHTHAGHDCQIGDGVIITQGSQIGGHVHIHDHAIVGGVSAVHQFVRIGSRAMIGGMSKVTRDVLPFSLCDGRPAVHYRLNAVGLKRAGITGSRYAALEAAFRLVREGQSLEELPEADEVGMLKAFVLGETKRRLSGFARGDSTFEG